MDFVSQSVYPLKNISGHALIGELTASSFVLIGLEDSTHPTSLHGSTSPTVLGGKVWDVAVVSPCERYLGRSQIHAGKRKKGTSSQKGSPRLIAG
jgi:hypothetical protein